VGTNVDGSDVEEAGSAGQGGAGFAGFGGGGAGARAGSGGAARPDATDERTEGAAGSVDAARGFDAADSSDSAFSDGRDAPSDAPTDTGEGCVRESRSEFCLRAFKNCNNVTAVDNCGIQASFDCGVCVPLEACGGTGFANVCGAPVNLVAPGGTVTASNTGVTPEDMTKAFDNDGATKWYVNAVTMVWVAYQFPAGQTHRVTSYGVTSGNDSPGRDPSSWQLQGSNDGTLWTALDTRTAETFANRLQMKIYPSTGAAAYSRFRFFVTAISSGTEFQVQEIQLFGD
jgi:hypothetical protein